MIWIDLKNAVSGNKDFDNFTCLLMRLMLKADIENMSKLGMNYPLEAQIVWLYHNSCSYKDSNHSEVDFELLELRATNIVKIHNGFYPKIEIVSGNFVMCDKSNKNNGKLMIKKLLSIIVLIIISVTGCSQQERTFYYGGTTTINLPPNRKLINITWKEDHIWYLTKQMSTQDVCEVYEFDESSSYGLLQGKVVVKEKR